SVGSCVLFSLSCIILPPPRPPLFPYTTLFRSPAGRTGHPRERGRERRDRRQRHGGDACRRRPWRALRRRHHGRADAEALAMVGEDRKSTRLNSSHVAISYAVFCLKKKKLTDVV